MTETGFNNGDLCLEWIEDIVKPFIEERGGGENGGKSVLFWDPAKCHITQEIKAALEKLNVICIFIPASLTYKYQLVDVCYAATFKRHYSQKWTAWMVKQLEKAYDGIEGAYMKKSLNYIKPTLARCVVWSQFAHEKMKLQKSMFAKKATALYMNGEDEEMAALMPDFYAGKFKKSYNAAPWAKAKN